MSTEEQKAKENFEKYAYARDSGHREFIRKAEKCQKYFYGEQWDSDVIAKLERQRRPALTINKVFSTIATVAGEQINSAADVSFHPTATGNPDTAEALTKLWINIANNNKLKWLEEDVFNAGIITSRGYFDVDVAFDDHMQGEARINYESPMNVIPDPDADEYDTDKWNEVFVTKWLTPNQIETMYNRKDVATEIKNRKQSQFQMGYDSLDHQMNSFGKSYNLGPIVDAAYRSDKNVRKLARVVKRQYREVELREHFVDTRTGDTRVVPKDWAKDKIKYAVENLGLAIIKKRAESIKFMVTVDDFVLFESTSPLKHFTIVPYFPFFHEGQTMGLIEHILSPQDQLNKTSSQMLHVINTTANSGYKVKRGSLLNMDPDELETRGAETGLVLEMNDINDIEKIAPNQVPTGLDRMVYLSDEAIKEISGVSDSKRGFDRADVAAKAIQAKQRAGSINLAVPMENLVRTRHMLATRVLDIVQAYYTEERSFKITGNGLLSNAEDVTVNQAGDQGQVFNDLTLGEYEVVVIDVPAKDTYEDQVFDEALRMRELGIAIPDDIIIEASRLPRKSEIAQRVRDLNGGGEATETEQQLAQLEMQLKQLEAENASADLLVKKADAAHKMAKSAD